MRVFQYKFEDEREFATKLYELKDLCNEINASNVLFQIFSETLKPEKIGVVLQGISRILPRALYIGSTTAGNIFEGDLKVDPTSIVVSALVFEDPDTSVKVFQYPLDEESEPSVVASIKEEVEKMPDAKLLQFCVTIRTLSMTKFCNDLSEISQDVAIIGGGAFNDDINDNNALVFSNLGTSDHSVVFALISGPAIECLTTMVSGWTPLGYSFHITRSSGRRLYEINDEPAYDIYYKYLKIKNDEHFFNNTLEFPFVYDSHGTRVLRAPTACYPDGSLAMTSDIEEGVEAHIAYGNPETILSCVREEYMSVARFAPDFINLFSCAARRTYWNGDSTETLPFNDIAPTTGFYTSGEFIRAGRDVVQHNVTLVIAAIREGEAQAKPVNTEAFSDEISRGKIPMVNRLANFIDAATEELEDANIRLEKSAVTDGLTGIFNRIEIQRRITAEVMDAGAAADPANLPSLIMIDIDNFKRINDFCGHHEGDTVIKALADLICDKLDFKFFAREGRSRSVIPSEHTAAAGRWGGEEFMLLLPATTEEEALAIAEDLRRDFSKTEFPVCGKQTISIGVSRCRPGENVDTLCVRVDNALYDAKNSGKNCVRTRE